MRQLEKAKREELQNKYLKLKEQYITEGKTDKEAEQLAKIKAFTRNTVEIRKDRYELDNLWKLDKEKRLIYLETPHYIEINLDYLTTQSDILYHIYDTIARKYGSPRVIYDLIEMFRMLFGDTDEHQDLMPLELRFDDYDDYIIV